MSAKAAGAPELPWTSSYPDDVDWAAPVSTEPLTVSFDRIVARFGKRPCIDFLGKRYSYARIGSLVARAAKGFRALGVGRGSLVGMLLPNTPYYVICYYAVLKAGGTVVNFNPLYVAEEIERQVEDSGTTIMVTLDMPVLLDKLAPALDRSCLERIIVCPMADILPFPKNFLYPLARRKDVAKVPDDGCHLRFSQLAHNDGVYEAAAIDPEKDIAVLQYTGGTTGVSKGAMLTHANIAANAHQNRMVNAGTPDGVGRVLGVLPLFHVFAMTVVMNEPILRGAEMILLPRFEVDATLDTIRKKRPTVMPGVPTIYNALEQGAVAGGYDLSCLEVCISGGASLPAHLQESFERMTGCRLVEGYGLSEASPVVCCNPLDGTGKPGSIGLPLPGTTIEIRDPEDPARCLPAGEKGEICVSGPQVMAGYWNRPDETARTIVDGFLHTGDVGYMDEDGYTFLVDRIKDVIICSGYKVYPRLIEEAIGRHEAVNEVTVIGVPDDYRGETPKAFVSLMPEAQLSDGELIAFLKDKLAPFEMPAYVEFRDELPKSLIGKLSKKELVAEEAARRAEAATRSDTPA